MSTPTPLPEPAYFTWADFESKVHYQPHYTAAQLQAYGAAEYARALEDAAKIAAARWDVLKETEAAHYRLSNTPFNAGNFGMGFTLAEESRDITYAIRALRSKT